MTISFIIPSIGRETLRRTVFTINQEPGDEILVIEDIPPSRMWGNPQRNKGMEAANGDYLAFIDDDDWYANGARKMMAQAIHDSPGKPILFRIEYPSGARLWHTREVIPGNVSTQMILVPNDKEMLHHWEAGRNMADFIFIDKWKWLKEDIVWRDEVIAYLGHN